MTSPRRTLTKLIAEKRIATADTNKALSISQLYPTGTQWQAFMDKLLLWLGVLALVFAGLFFIAYNWFEMGRFGKFLLVQLGIVASTLAYVFYPHGSYTHASTADNTEASTANNTQGHAHTLLLLTSSLLLGGLLALFGQVYQTGADPWQLFATWAVLMLPWAVISRSPVLWLLWLGLLNISLALYSDLLPSSFILLGITLQHTQLWLFAALNMGLFVLWRLLSPRFAGLASGWLAYPLAMLALGSITQLASLNVFTPSTVYAFTALVWLLCVSVFVFWYRIKTVNIAMLSLVALASIVFITTMVADVVLESLHDDGFLVMAVFVISFGTVSVRYLKALGEVSVRNDIESI